MGPTADGAPWTVVVPVKSLSTAKSRLTVPGALVADLALAFLADVVAAAQGATRVGETIVTSADPTVRDVAARAGADVVDDTGHDGINVAARFASAGRRGQGGVAVVVADLACLTSAALDRVLAAAAAWPVSFVADADGVGTAMWLSRDGDADGPDFGPSSRAAHRAHGAHDLVADEPGASGPWLAARLDVDTPADLDRARVLGLGPAAARLLADLPAPVPATVLRTEGDAVVLVGEDGRAFRRPRRAFDDAGWRTVPTGQRVMVVDDRIGPPA